METRNTSIAKLLLSEHSAAVPSINQITTSHYNYSTDKAGVGKREIPEIVTMKNVVLSPPQVEFHIQDYPLKRVQRGLSGWDWKTETSDEQDLTDRAVNCKPRYSTFSKLFPSRNLSMYPPKRHFYRSEEPLPLVKEFNRRVDRLSDYRENMLKAQQLFKFQ